MRVAAGVCAVIVIVIGSSRFPSDVRAQTNGSRDSRPGDDTVQISSRPSSASTAVKTRPFVAGNFGNERRTFGEAPSVETSSQLLSTVKGGVELHLRPGFMMAPAFGVAMKFEEGGRMSPYTEVEINHTFKTGGYAGTGFGVWDIGHDAHEAAATVLIHFGAPLVMSGPARARWLLTYESRLFFGQLNNIDNNYQAMVGLRYVFR